ncbi:hypothetical protein [Glycomyces salinus]|uniref:hypothetical protein n=1 Tax=Glycomyces salinus TaxID=980294 RepID=UPI0018EAB58C|nr:hypothetical protein [Glycomyces salinus]
MNHHRRQALFKEHAAAVLRRDTAGAARALASIGPESWMGHQLFVFSLFASTVTDHFGDDLDRADLAELMAEFRTARPDAHWLRAEALIRSCYGESSLYLDVPQSEHWSLMWAVLALIVPPDPGETTLTVLFDRADDLGREVVSGIFESERLFGWADEPEDPPQHREEAS